MVAFLKYILEFSSVMCLGIQKRPVLTFADILTTLFKDIKEAAMFALESVQVMSIRPQINIKVSFSIGGAREVYLRTQYDSFSLRTEPHGEASVFVALIGPSLLFIS